MNSTALDLDFLEDMSKDSHELWELYGFIRLHYPNFSEAEVIRRGHQLISEWIIQGLLTATPSRLSKEPLADHAILELVNNLGTQASDSKKGILILSLTEKAHRLFKS